MEYLLWVEVSPKIHCRALHCLILEFPSSLQSCFYPFESAHISCHRLITIHIVSVLPKFFVSCQSKWEIPKPNPTHIYRNYPCKMNLLSEAILYIKQGLRRFLCHTWNPYQESLRSNTLSILHQSLDGRRKQFIEQSPESVMLQTDIMFFLFSFFHCKSMLLTLNRTDSMRNVGSVSLLAIPGCI